MFCTQFFLLDCQLQVFDLVDFNLICFKFLMDIALKFKFYKIIARLQEGAIVRQPAPYFLDGEELFGRQRRYKQQILFGNLKINVWLSIKQIFVCKIRFRDGLLRQLSQCFLQGKAEEADRYEWFCARKHNIRRREKGCCVDRSRFFLVQELQMRNYRREQLT